VGLPVLAHGVSTHARSSATPRRRKSNSRFTLLFRVAFPTKPQGRHVELVISELNTRPTCASVNASPRTLPPPAHDSRPEWLARPSPYDSFIRYSMPVYPGAFGLPRARACAAAQPVRNEARGKPTRLSVCGGTHVTRRHKRGASPRGYRPVAARTSHGVTSAGQPTRRSE
jgi:hypothetical protein